MLTNAVRVSQQSKFHQVGDIFARLLPLDAPNHFLADRRFPKHYIVSLLNQGQSARQTIGCSVCKLILQIGVLHIGTLNIRALHTGALAVTTVLPSCCVRQWYCLLQAASQLICLGLRCSDVGRLRSQSKEIYQVTAKAQKSAGSLTKH